MSEFEPRRRDGMSGGRLAAILVLCAVIALVVTVTVGNLMKIWLDDETYARLTSTKEEEGTPVKYQSYLHDVQAYPYRFGDRLSSVSEHPEVSLLLNEADGTMTYTSPVVEYYGLAHEGDYALGENLGTLGSVAVYVSGVFHPQVFADESPDLRFAATARETAILREFLRTGGSEILLVGLCEGEVATTDVVAYAKAVKEISPTAPVGVALSLSVLKRADGWELLGALLGVCDFCAVDLCGADGSESAAAWLDAADYYLSQYDMRLLLTSSQTALLDEAAEREIADLQIIR